MAGPTTHHCPGDGNGGSCDHKSKMPNKQPYCKVHQIWCLTCLKNKPGTYKKHLKTEPCPRCTGAAEAQQQRKDQENRAKKDKELSDKLAKEKAEKAKKAGGRR